MEEVNPDNYYKWDKEKFINKKIDNNRTLSWFERRYRRNLTIALTLAGITFFNTCLSAYLFKAKNSEIKVYLTASSGKIIQYKNNEDRIDAINRALPIAKQRQ